MKKKNIARLILICSVALLALALIFAVPLVQLYFDRQEATASHSN